MSETDIRKTLAERYNESVVLPPPLSTDLPALMMPHTERPTSEEYTVARRQTVRFLVVILIAIGVLVIALVGMSLATGFVYPRSV